MTNKNISITKLDLASCINLNIRNQKGWVAVEYLPGKGHSRVIAIRKTKKELQDEINNNLWSEEEEDYDPEWTAFVDGEIQRTITDRPNR